MVDVALPEIGLLGEWSVSEAERTVAARLLTMLPPAALPGADSPTRWRILQTTLYMIRDELRDNGKLLFGGRRSVQERPGKVEMIDMIFVFSTLLAGIADGHRVASSAGKGNVYLEGEIVRLEPEVAEFRRLLEQVAAP